MVVDLALHTTPTDRILRVILREGNNVPERSLSRAGNNQSFSTSGLRMTIFFSPGPSVEEPDFQKKILSLKLVRVSICVVRVLGCQ